MIDLHCHILPAFDDGPSAMEEAIDMCRAAAADGVKTIVATPHFKPGTHTFTAPEIDSAIDRLTAEVNKQGIDICILAGAEVAVNPEMTDHIISGGYLTINQGRYFLAEFPLLSVPAGWDAFLATFIQRGLTPIIAHPERNPWFTRHPEALAKAVQHGVLIQISAMSLTGEFGIEARDICVYLLRQNLVHAIASDGHSADFRPPLISESVRLAADVVGQETAVALVTTIPRAIIESRAIPFMEPAPFGFPIKAQKRSWFMRLMALRFSGA